MMYIGKLKRFCLKTVVMSYKSLDLDLNTNKLVAIISLYTIVMSMQCSR